MRLKIPIWALVVLFVFWSCDPNEPDSIYVNTAPSIQDYSFKVPENISDAELIGKVSATDADEQALTFSIQEDASGLFALSKSGELRLASGKSLDFETKDEHVITVYAHDGIVGRPGLVTITVVNVIEDGIELQEFHVKENITQDDIMGMIIAPDVLEGSLEYAILEGDGDLIEINDTGEFRLGFGQSLDYEKAQEHKFLVKISDTKNSREVQVVIVVVNIAELDDPNSFLTTWKVDTDGQSVTIGTDPVYAYDYAINWGDGTLENRNEGNPTHVYEVAGTYTVAIQGEFPAIRMENSDAASKGALESVDQWGSIDWQSMHRAFYECGNMVYNASDLPNLSKVESMSGMFYFATSFNADLNEWDVSNVTDMSQLFFNADAFNGAIGTWDVSNVVNMSEMFFTAGVFNQDIGNWDVGNVTMMKDMFGFTVFNQDISNWNVGKVQNMSGIFGGNAIFNQNIGIWNVSDVTDMSAMFSGATSFNQDIGGWDVSNVTDMSFMFFNANAFNQDISNWDISNVSDLTYTFNGADSFNQDIGKWNVGNVTDLNGMLSSALSFDYSLANWNIGNVAQMSEMLNNCGLSTENFNATLLGWHKYVNDHSGPSGVTLGASGLVACGADVSMAAISLNSDSGWKIEGAIFEENCN